MENILRYGVIVSFLFAVISLSILVLKTFSFGKKKLHAEPAGDVKTGILYAFTKGMMPWEKESARNHLPSYIVGILYHIGVFTGLLYLAAVIIGIGPAKLPLIVLQTGCQVGFISGVALLLKRVLSPQMRALSCPDDLAANIFVDVFLAFAYFQSVFPVVTPHFFVAAMVMFLYMPFGKIRHCVFFFYVRILFGIFFGRRGVYPPKSHLT